MVFRRQDLGVRYACCYGMSLFQNACWIEIDKNIFIYPSLCRNLCIRVSVIYLFIYHLYSPTHLPTYLTAAARLLLSCLTLCDPIDGSPPGSPVPGILQARTLEWVAISFSNAWKWNVKVKPLSHVRLLATPWTAAHQAPPSMGFSRQEYWSGYLPIKTVSSYTHFCL